MTAETKELPQGVQDIISIAKKMIVSGNNASELMASASTIFAMALLSDGRSIIPSDLSRLFRKAVNEHIKAQLADMERWKGLQ